MRTLVLIVAVLFATSAHAAEGRSLTQSDRQADSAGEKSEAKVSEAKADEKKKPIAKKHESDEDKARRIAKRYGVTW